MITKRDRKRAVGAINKAARALEKNWDAERAVEILLDKDGDDEFSEGLSEIIEGLAVSGGNATDADVAFLLGEIDEVDHEIA